MNLRPYQIELINSIRKNIKYNSICIQSPCGSGKSIVQGMIASNATAKKNRVLFLVHRKELCKQIEQTFIMCNVDFGYCRVEMVQTVCRNVEKEPVPNIIITDENHHCLARSYIKIYDSFPEAIKLGFTATPIRLGGKGLGSLYNILIKGPDIDWLINNKYLAPFKLYSKQIVTTNNLHIENGDYNKKEVKDLMEKQFIYGQTIKNYTELAKNKKTIVYCSSIKSSIETVDEFNLNGFKAIHLDSKTPKKEREEIVEKFRNSEVQILSNVDLFGEGFDVPDCECVILLRPTKSLSLYIQQSMRSMRYKDNKLAIIIDHVGNCFEHGLPNHKHPWSLNDWTKRKKNQTNEEKIKQCPECFAALEPSVSICPYCGYEFVQKGKKPKQVKDVILEEITQTDILKAKPYSYYKKITTLKELIDFAEIKNYKSGWLIYKIDELKDQLEMVFDDFVNIQQKNKYKFAWTIHKCKTYNIEIPEKYNNYGRYLSQ